MPSWMIVQQDATVFSLLHICGQPYMFRVLTPIIRSSYNCNYSFWHWSTGSTTIPSRCWVARSSIAIRLMQTNFVVFSLCDVVSFGGTSYLYESRRCTVHFVKSLQLLTNKCTYITLKRLKPLRHVSIFSDHHQGVSSFLVKVITYSRFSSFL